MTLWQWNRREIQSSGLPGGITFWDTTTQVPLAQTESLQRLVYRSSIAGQVYVPFDNPPPTPTLVGVLLEVSVAYGPDDRDWIYTQRRYVPWANGWVVSTGLGGILFWTLAEPRVHEFDMDVRRGPGIELAHTVTITIHESLFGLGDYDGDMHDAPPQTDYFSSVHYLTADTSIPG